MGWKLLFRYCCCNNCNCRSFRIINLVVAGASFLLILVFKADNGEDAMLLKCLQSVAEDDNDDEACIVDLTIEELPLPTALFDLDDNDDEEGDEDGSGALLKHLLNTNRCAIFFVYSFDTTCILWGSCK